MVRSSFRKGKGGIQALRSRGGNGEVVHEALERLGRHAHFQAYTKSTRIDFRERTLIITGILPSFYLKQVLQTILRDTPGVVRIDNRVEVVPAWHPSNGHSSTPKNSSGERHD